MADNDVKIKVSVDGADTASKGLKGVGDSASSADGKLSGLQSGLKGAGAAVGTFALAAAAAGAALTAGVVNAYAAAEQSVGGIETLFKGSADTMKNYAKDAYKDAGLSANAYMAQATSMSAALIQSVGGDTAKAAELANVALVSMSDNANKMGTDLGSIQTAFSGFAKQNFTMLDNLKLGYGGTQEEMQRLLSDAEKLPGALGQDFDMSNYGDVVTAIQLIQEEMGIAGTTALEASTTISGSVGTLKGAFDNLLVSMGSANNESLAFLDVQEQAANVVTSLETVIGNVIPVIESIGSSIATLGPQLGGMGETIIGALGAALPAILNAGVALVGGLLQGIVSALPSLLPALLPAVVQLVDTIATLGPQLITAGAQAIVSLATGISQAIPTLIPAVITGILAMVRAIIAAAPLLLDAGIQLLMGLATGILESLPLIIAMLPQLIEGIVSFLETALPDMLDAGIKLFGGIIEALPTAISSLLAALPSMITAIIGAILSATPLIIQAGITLLVALVGALPTIITTIVAALPTIITSIITAVVGAIPLLVQAGIDLFLALITALPQIIVSIVSAIPQIIIALVDGIIGAIPDIIMAGVQLLVALVSNMPAIIGGIIKAIPAIVTGIFNAFTDPKMLAQLGQAGLQLIQGLWQGISDAGAWLYSQISGFFGGVVDNIKDFFGINSPSKLMADEIGAMLPSGIGLGITVNADDAIKPIQDLNAKILAEASGLNTSVAFTHDSNLTQTLVPNQATPASYGAVSVDASFDENALTQALMDALAPAQGQDAAPLTLSDGTINKLAGAIVSGMRTTGRQGPTVLG